MHQVIFILLLLTACSVTQKFKLSDKVMLSCEDDESCSELSKTAKCIDNSCKCDNVTCNFNTHSSAVTRIGETCASLKYCFVDHSYCLDQRCTCKLGFVESLNKRQCLNVSRGIGEDCLEDSQCSAVISESICKNNTCICPIDRKAHLTSCFKIRELGDTCESPYECAPSYSTCNGTCKCGKRYMGFNNECLLIPQNLLSSCRENAQCKYAFGNGALCKDGFCMCKDLYHLMKSTNKCTIDYLLGEKCGNHSECHQPGGEESKLDCVLGECKCKSQFTEVDNFCVSCELSLAAHALPTLLILFQALLRLFY